MRVHTLPAACGLVLALGACGDNASPTSPPSTVRCSTAGGPVTLAALQGTTATTSDLPTCLSLAADGGTYLVVPQFPTQTAPVAPVSFEVGTQAAAMASASRLSFDLARQGRSRPPGLQQRFDRLLRAAEHRLAPAAARWASARAAQGASAERVSAAVVPPLGSTASFQVLANLNGSAFKTDTAVLRYIGTNILIYVDQHAPAPPNGFTDAQLAAFGNQFDQELYDVDVATFGSPSDIDGNGHVIVLMTNLVNALTPASSCSTQGFVAGFFYGLDLLPSQPHSNKGEIFYSLVPDPSGRFSCAHSVDQVGRQSAATFIHEFQHMISFNQHVLVRQGPDEVDWLNEGLSHIAEELGSRYYEHKYPPPSGRTDPRQLFPDSAQPFITGDLFNSYDYLLNSMSLADSASVSDWPGNGTLEERGAAWLFLRWLGDQQDSTVYGRLDQTSLTGVANIEAASGEKFTQLFGDFSLALYTDSLPGVSRDAIPPRNRFTSRNLRQLYQALFNAVNGPTTDVPRPFPIQLVTVPTSGAASASMFPGTMGFFRVQLPASGAAERLHVSQPGGAPFDAALNAQVSVFRCPSPQACQ